MEAQKVQNDQQMNSNNEEELTNVPPPPPPPFLQPPSNLDQVEAILEYVFKNKSLLEMAFAHPSYDKVSNFQRLEYIGDSQLNFMVTREQHFLYPDFAPGMLTRLRSANVDNEKLARVAIKHELYRYLRHNKPLFHQQIQNFITEITEYPSHSNGLVYAPKILADLVEATIGAIASDCNFCVDTVWKIVKPLLEPMIEPDTLRINPMTEFNEACQKLNLRGIKFIDLWKESNSFEVFVNHNIFIARGTHSTKKEVAQNRAAKNAMENLRSVLHVILLFNVWVVVVFSICMYLVYWVYMSNKYNSPPA